MTKKRCFVSEEAKIILLSTIKILVAASRVI